jgi:uroporphyrinogen-III synthase
VACIGPVTADIAKRLGVTTTIMPSESTVPSLVDAIVAHTQPTAPQGEPR